MTWKDSVIDFLVRYGFKILGAVVILVVGGLVARWVGKFTQQWLSREKLDLPIQKLLSRAARVVVMVLTLVIVVAQLGVEITPLIAGLGVAGVGIGLAVQGVLGNLVAGLTILFTKPFRVGEYIELLGVNGQVTDIELFSTTLVHADCSRVVIPNRKVVGEVLHNYGAIRQLDLNVGVAYASDLNKTFNLIHKILGKNTRVLKDPAPLVGVALLGDSVISVAIKPWVSISDYGIAQAELYQAIVEQFRADHIEIPFPQREVRLLNEPSPSTRARS